MSAEPASAPLRRRCGEARRKAKPTSTSCLKCGTPANILVHQAAFCRACLTEKVSRDFAGALRAGLAHTARNAVRRVLVVLEESYSSRVLQLLCTRSTTPMIEYRYHSAESLAERGPELGGSAQLGYQAKLERLKEVAKSEQCSCILLSSHSTELALILLQLIRTGKIAEFTSGVKRGESVSVVYPLAGLSYKSFLYYCHLEQLFEHRVRRPEAAGQQQLDRADKELVKRLLKESPVSLSNLVQTQLKLTERLAVR